MIRAVLLLLFSASLIGDDVQQRIPADFDTPIVGVTNDFDFSAAVIQLRKQGHMVDIKRPFLLNPIILKLDRSNLTIRKILDRLKVDYGLDSTVQDSLITIYDPKLHPSDKAFPLNRSIQHFIAVDEPCRKVLEELSFQSGTIIVSPSNRDNERPVSINVIDSSVEGVLTAIRDNLGSRGWDCLINRDKNGPGYTILVQF